jgi:hypothetical protein
VAPAALASLTAVLSEAAVPTSFELLVVGAAANAVNVVNDLVSDRVFMPALIVLAVEVPTDSAALEQLGLNAAVASSYDVIATSPRSLTLARIDGTTSAF